MPGANPIHRALGLSWLTLFSCTSVTSTDHAGLDAGFDATLTSDSANPGIYPHYRLEPRHQGISPPGANLGAELVLEWQTPPFGIGNYSASKSSPAVDVDRVYVGVDDGRLLALDRKSGAPVWQFRTHRFFTETNIIGSQHLGIHGSPAFDEKQVYIGDYDGFLYAVDKTSGILVWERKLGGSIGASPTLHNQFIYIAVEYPTLDGKVFVLDRANGTIIWSTPFLGAHPHSSVSLDTDRGLLFVGTNQGVLYCFDILHRTLKWMYQTAGAIKSTPAVGSDSVYVTSWDNQLHAVAIDDGRKLFTFTARDVTMSSPSIADGRVFFGSHDARLYALNAATGELLWSFDTQGPILSSPTLLPLPQRLVVGSNDRTAYILDMVKGTLIRSIALPSSISGVPVVVENNLFLNDDSGRVTCYRSSNTNL